jgi:hypothetical protein
VNQLPQQHRREPPTHHYHNNSIVMNLQPNPMLLP